MSAFTEDWLRDYHARMGKTLGRPKLTVVAGGEAVKTPRQPAERHEQALQIAAITFLDAALPREWRVMHAANGGWRSGAEAGIFKAMGVKPGYPDLTFVGRFGRIALAEAKAERGRLTASQEEWRDWCLAWSIPWFVFRSIDELIAGCTDAGIPLRTRTA